MYNIFIRFGKKLYRQVVGILMGTNCAPPMVADLFLFCYERDFMMSLLMIRRLILLTLFIPPANFVCRGYTVFTLSVRPSVRPSVCPSVRPSVRNALFP